jgi:CAAX protease family protein
MQQDDAFSHASRPNATEESPTSNAPEPDESYAASGPERQLFADVFMPEHVRPERIPNFGHFGILALIALTAYFVSGMLTIAAVYFRLFGVSTIEQAQANVRYTLGGEALFYLLGFLIASVVFPLLWHKSFFSGLHWNGFIALRASGRLISVALLCFLLALVNGYLMPGPENTPIDRVFREPGAAWLLFAFGVTMAPFFEELAFRGFLLPSFCTAIDWVRERFAGAPQRPVDLLGNPDWSRTALLLGSVLTSVPFALMHAYQTGHALGPFLLLLVISMVLCSVRLTTRSLAASVLVHASYNCLLFIFMLVGTGGFKHLENM